MSINDQPRPGRPFTDPTEENIVKIRDQIPEDRVKNIAELPMMFLVTWSSLQQISKDFV
jgi:hypothetical protein